MKLKQVIISKEKVTEVFQTQGFENSNANLVLAFSERTYLEKYNPYHLIKEHFPNAEVVICSSSGQISQANYIEQKVVVTAIQFEKSTIKAIEIDIYENESFENSSKNITNYLLENEKPTSILIISDGTLVNGTELVDQLKLNVENKIPIFGGLAGDEDKFEKTMVGLNKNAEAGKIVAVGFYGNSVKFGYGSHGGWGDFGPEREVTKSHKNVLYQIGERNALDLYKEYLGNYADKLPGASLYFPLSMRENEYEKPVVRTILSIDEENKSMTFAGNIPENSLVRLMRANNDELIDAAFKATYDATSTNPNPPELAFLVSCVGRRIVLANRVEEELEAAQEVLGENTLMCGFYSFGEISPLLDKLACELHNQTLTITTISEVI